MTKAAAIQNSNNGSMSLTVDETINVLRASLYPGADIDSVKMVINYCVASGLDPFQKPVHIVPMYAATGRKDSAGKDIKAMRDVVMPGIGLYRTQASRSGQYAGVTEPEFGEDVTENLGGLNVIYPKWCKVIVKRQMENGAIVEFAAKELWKENYATKSKDSATPNSMWFKRPYGQIAKCAEAQALRKAFPEIGSQPTADEMEGKFDEYIDGNTSEIVNKKIEKPVIDYYTDEDFSSKSGEWYKLIESGKQTDERLIKIVQSKGKLFTEEQLLTINGWGDLANESK